jgi:hypothetical protein
MPGELESFRVDEVDVCRRHGENDAVWLCDVFRNEVSGLFFDVRRLVADGNLRHGVKFFSIIALDADPAYLCQAGQINQRQAQHMRRIYLEVDRLPVDALVAPCYARSFGFDFPFDLGEVIPSSSWNMVKLCPFLLTGNAGWSVRHVYFVGGGFVVPFAGDVDELQNQWPPCDYATPPGEEVSADDVLEYGGFSRRLRSNDNLLWLAWQFRKKVGGGHTICGRSRESFPMVLKTKSWSLLTM